VFVFEFAKLTKHNTANSGFFRYWPAVQQGNQIMMKEVEYDIFVVPIIDRYLIYAPLHNLLALVDELAVQEVRQTLSETTNTSSRALRPIVNQLLALPQPQPTTNTGEAMTPLFLGIIPTRGCNMGCHYCDFAAPKHSSPIMSLDIVKSAIDSYLNLLQEIGNYHAEVQFFGGEPFYAETLIHFVVGYASMRAAQCGLSIRFEATTNGLYSASRCQWIANHFDTVVLSLDGPADIHNANRPALNGRGTFEVVTRSATIFSESDVNLVIRACITDNATHLMPEIARWIGETYRPGIVCLETLSRSSASDTAGLKTPDPWAFGINFNQASHVLAEYGIRAVFATAEIQHNRATFCPVGQDALIVSPDGSISACYLIAETWREKGLDMHLGHINLPLTQIDVKLADLNRVRQNSVHNRSLCANCLCRFHCAGGCHVHHDTSAPPGTYDDLCIQTRIITISKLLNQLGQHDLVTNWLVNHEALQTAIMQANDRI
jgi:uncharacterized protein